MRTTAPRAKWLAYPPLARRSRDARDVPFLYQASRASSVARNPHVIVSGVGSDRTLCYLASGKRPWCSTGPVSFLPSGEGMFRVSTVEETAEALTAVDADCLTLRAERSRDFLRCAWRAVGTLERCRALMSRLAPSCRRGVA
jgi:hypothetical protein